MLFCLRYEKNRQLLTLTFDTLVKLMSRKLIFIILLKFDDLGISFLLASKYGRISTSSLHILQVIRIDTYVSD